MFCVDAFVPGKGVVIQFDGDYWHANPVLFPNPDARQRRRIPLDKSQDAYMRACGYKVLRLWEGDIRNQRELVIGALLMFCA
jgi:very-short-patch-repair endonuclease